MRITTPIKQTKPKNIFIYLFNIFIYFQGQGQTKLKNNLKLHSNIHN